MSAVHELLARAIPPGADLPNPNEEAVFRPWEEEARRDPYPRFRALREQDPVHRVDFLIGWVLTRWDDSVSVLKDGDLFSSRPGTATIEQLWEAARKDGTRPPRVEPPDTSFAVSAFFERSPLFTDRPDHTRLRGLVNRGFTPRVVTRLRPRIEQIVSELLDEMVGAGEVDFMKRFAIPLPAIVIAELLGVPAEIRDDFKRWSEGIVVLFDPVRTEEAEYNARVCAGEMHAFFTELFEERRRRPQDDLISRLVAFEREGDALDEAELLAMCMLLLAAGHETTTNLLGNGLYTLFEHPDQLQRLRDDPSRVRPAIEELLRWESPVQGMPRVATRDCEIRGREIRKGDYVVVLVGAANRDPEIFSDPERLDIARGDNRHLAFGYGPHFCLGAPLARAEAEIALRALFQRAPHIEAAYGRVDWKPTQVMRGLVDLPVRV